MRLDKIAAQTWDREEPIEKTAGRIHDGHKGDVALAQRARGYVERMIFGTYPNSLPPAEGTVMEIGSGIGWIMQAMNEHLQTNQRAAREIIGLDIAPNMLAKAKTRLGTQPPYQFLIYDGISVPLPDKHLDLIYSVASLQHVPKAYVYNLFFEIQRLLKDGGHAIIHLPATDVLQLHWTRERWQNEITIQVKGQEAHWMFFYTKKELEDVLAITGFANAIIKERNEQFICCLSNLDNGEHR